jgi:hypothetical protein
MSFSVTPTTTLASAVANGGTVVLDYPSGTTQATFIGSNAAPNTGAVIINNNEVYPEATSGVRVAISYGASNVTITNNTGATWAAGSTIRAQFGRVGNDRPGFTPGPAITPVTTAFGTAADALVDVTATPTQTTINNNFASVIRYINRLEAALRSNGLIG